LQLNSSVHAKHATLKKGNFPRTLATESKVINTVPDYVPVFHLSGTSRIGTVDTVFLVPGVKK